MAANRPYAGNGAGANSAYPGSPAPTTASSLNYSQYGSGSFTSPSRNPSANVQSSSSSSYAGGGAQRQPSRQQTQGSNGGPGLRPPEKGGERKGESREVARMHWRALKDFLREWLEKESPTARASAREKLTRLTKLQFQELSTDVYDELMRRIDMETGAPNVPFLPVREDFHPKRNQARQKLATLPKNRFKDLASDVFHELRRRYPEFGEDNPCLSPSISDLVLLGKEDPDVPPHAPPGPYGSYLQAQETMYDDEPPPAPGPTNRPQYAQHPSSQSLQNSERQRSNPTPPPVSRLNSSSSHQRQGSRNISGGSSVGSGVMSRPRPSRDNTREYEGSNITFNSQPGPTAATNDVVVPVKSRMKEEEIEVPYARESVMERPISSASSRRQSRSSSMHERPGARTPRGDREREQPDLLSPQSNDDRDYYDRISFSSHATNKSRAHATGWDEEREQKIRAEYEFRVAGLERKVGQVETERDEARRRENDEKIRRVEWEDEVRGLKERAALHASNLRSIQHELDIARDEAKTAQSHAEQSGRQAQDELEQWRERCENLEEDLRRLEVEKSALEAANGAGNGAGNSNQAVTELKNEIHSLVDELNALSRRNDDLLTERDEDGRNLVRMETQVSDYKRKFEAVRIELRNLKATSTMFISKPANDDHLPASPDGNIADMHVSSFQASIDGMLAAARSSAPSGVLPAMKAIVEAMSAIGEDVKAFEAEPNLDVDVSKLESLKHESTTRLNSLMQAARNHAMASGLSPVSLIDGAAGHLSANVIEIIKLLKIRRTDKSAGLRANRSSLSIKDMVDRSRSGAGTPIERSASRGLGAEERLREPPTMSRQMSMDSERSVASGSGIYEQLNGNGNGTSLAVAPGYGGSRQVPNLRINSYQSQARSSIARSDSFDLERKASVTSERPFRVGTERLPPLGSSAFARTSEASEGSSATSAARGNGYGRQAGRGDEDEEDRAGEGEGESPMFGGGTEQEWDEVKPYLETQSSALVNSIQNLLAAIRTGGQTPALNEHLSEVIAIASSIVAVSTNALPSGLHPEGSPLLKDLVMNTNKLSEAQELAKGSSFDKAVRQAIASASFGVAKSLKALMKLGNE